MCMEEKDEGSVHSEWVSTQSVQNLHLTVLYSCDSFSLVHPKLTFFSFVFLIPLYG